jgi:hypothetical protein
MLKLSGFLQPQKNKVALPKITLSSLVLLQRKDIKEKMMRNRK